MFVSRLAALSVACLVLLTSVGSGSVQAADGEPGGLPPGVKVVSPGGERAPIEFGAFLEAARSEARETDRPILLLLSRRRPASEPCVEFETRLFADDRSGALAERVVPVRLLGGDDLTTEATTCLRRFDVEGYPTLLLIDAELHLLARLEAVDLASLGAELDAALERDAAFDDLLEGQTGLPGSESILADAFRRRCAWEELLPLCVDRVHAEPTPAAYDELMDVCRHLGDRDFERRLVDQVLEKFPDDDRRIAWHLRGAELSAGTLDRAHAAGHYTRWLTALSDVHAVGQAREDTALSVAALVRRGHLLLRTDPLLEQGGSARADFDTALGLDPEAAWEASALWGLALCDFRESALDACERRLLELVDRHPDSEEAGLVPAALNELERRRPRPAGRPGDEGDADGDEEGTDEDAPDRGASEAGGASDSGGSRRSE